MNRQYLTGLKLSTTVVDTRSKVGNRKELKVLAYVVPADRHGVLDWSRAGKQHIVDHYGRKLCDGRVLEARVGGKVQTHGGHAADDGHTCKRCLNKGGQA